MKWTVDTASLPEYLLVSTEGKPSIVDTTALWTELLAGEYWQSGTCVLFDNRKMDAYPTDGSGSAMISQALDYFQTCSEKIGDSRLAVLIARRENFVFHRQFQYGVSLRGMPANVQIFYNEDDAKSWLDACSRRASV